MPSVLSILFGAALLVRCLRLKCVREEENVIAYACGAALLGMAAFILCDGAAFGFVLIRAGFRD